jgi:hypothetical protein
MGTYKPFVRNFQSWVQTHHEVVAFITLSLNLAIDSEAKEMHESQGTVGLYQLAENWTNEFEKLHVDTDWDQTDYWETIEAFCEQKNKVQ